MNATTINNMTIHYCSKPPANIRWPNQTIVTIVGVEKDKIVSCVGTRCNLWVSLSTCYQTLIQLMVDVNSWKVVKRMIKQSHYLISSLWLR